jgi:hypothetical protein
VGEPETTGTILARTVELLRGNALVAGVTILGLAAIDTLLDASPRQSVAVGGIISLVAQYALTIAALRKLGLARDGDRGARIPALFGLLLLTGAATLIGLLLLIVPGVILLARWSIAVPILLGEHATVGAAMRQSWERTTGRFWPIFGVLAIYIVVLIIASTVAVLVFADNIAGTLVTNLVVNLMVVAVWYAAIAIYERGRGETEALQEVFT